MNNVFKFFVLHPPDKISGSDDHLTLHTNSLFQRSAAAAMEEDSSDVMLATVVKTFMSDESKYVNHSSQLKYGKAMESLFIDLMGSAYNNYGVLVSAIKTATGATPTSLVNNKTFINDVQRCKDSFIAQNLSKKPDQKQVNKLKKLIQTYELVIYLANHPKISVDEKFAVNWYKYAMVFPDKLSRKEQNKRLQPARQMRL